MLKKMNELAGFLSGFWRDETSQMTKADVLGVASTLAVLSVAVMPQIAAASTACDGVCPNCEGPPCSLDYPCTNPPQCNQYYVTCVGGSPGHVLICTGGAKYCSTCTSH